MKAVEACAGGEGLTEVARWSWLLYFAVKVNIACEIQST